MKNIYGVYGASGFGREVMPLLEEQVASMNESNKNIYFIDDSIDIDSLNNYPVIDFDSFLRLPADEHHITVVISDSKTRQLLTNKCLENNVKLLSLRASNVITLTEVDISYGSILCPFVTLTSNIVIGKSFHANIYSYVAHDCIIGDYVTFAPGVKCNGNVSIEDHAYIGTGAIIKQGKLNKPIRIGKGAIVSAGSFVTKNVPDGMTVCGNPAEELNKENLRRMRNA